MSNHTDTIGIGTLIRWAVEHATTNRIVGPRRLREKTIRVHSSLSVHELFSALQEQRRLSPSAATDLYWPVRAGVYHQLRDRHGRSHC